MNNDTGDIKPGISENVSLTNFFESKKNDINISWRHGAFKVWYNIKRFFCSPLRSVRPKKDLNLISQVEILLQTDQSYNKETIEKCAQFISLHRHMENTSARKRLEKWAKYVISVYLMIVLAILLLEGGLFDKWNIKLTIGYQVTIVLLSTTTINIIGLGLIVLRGHFYQKELDREDLKNQKKNEDKI